MFSYIWPGTFYFLYMHSL